MTSSYPYGRMYRPPAPVLPIRVGSPGSLASVLLTALVDTGAGKTALPAEVLVQLGLPVAGRTMVSGFDGQPRIAPTYTVEIRVADYNTVLRVIGLGAVALLGRDILNVLSITLRGPQGIIVIDVPQR